MDAVETIELRTVLCPIWASAKTCKHLFGLSSKFINELVDDGIVRRKKTGATRQHAALYNVADINDWFSNEPKP